MKLVLLHFSKAFVFCIDFQNMNKVFGEVKARCLEKLRLKTYFAPV